MRRTLLLLLAALGTTGCLPRTTVHKDPGPHDKGVRYYRPKPYLLLKPMMAKDQPVEGYVTIEQVTLPDFSEEYSIHVCTGLGTNNTEINLEDGWNLTGLNVKLDSQFDENLRATADLVKAVPTMASAADIRMPVKASNVPLGLYEAVISKGPDCTKRLYGFRYVGFMPYSSCPIEVSGLEHQHCQSSVVYGLAFEDGAMVFRSLGELADPRHANTTRVKIDAAATQATTAEPAMAPPATGHLPPPRGLPQSGEAETMRTVP